MKIQKTLVFNNNSYHVCIDTSDPSGEGCIREIFFNNEYILENFKNLQSNIIDIGANCGMASIILAKQNPNSIIYAFEPDYNTFLLLKENVSLNNLQNVKFFNLAVSDSSNKKLILYKHPDYSGGNTTCSEDQSFKTFFNKDINKVEVDCISFDDIIQQFNIDQVELLKIDCEGAEYEIIYNSKYIRMKKVKNIVGEFHNLKYNTLAENNSNKLLEYCNSFIDGIKKITMLTI